MNTQVSGTSNGGQLQGSRFRSWSWWWTPFIAHASGCTRMGEMRKVEEATPCLPETVTRLSKVDPHSLWNLFSWPGLSN